MRMTRMNQPLPMDPTDCTISRLSQAEVAPQRSSGPHDAPVEATPQRNPEYARFQTDCILLLKAYTNVLDPPAGPQCSLCKEEPQMPQARCHGLPTSPPHTPFLTMTYNYGG